MDRSRHRAYARVLRRVLASFLVDSLCLVSGTDTAACVHPSAGLDSALVAAHWPFSGCKSPAVQMDADAYICLVLVILTKFYCNVSVSAAVRHRLFICRPHRRVAFLLRNTVWKSIVPWQDDAEHVLRVRGSRAVGPQLITSKTAHLARSLMHLSSALAERCSCTTLPQDRG